jgi:hypothetical protein
MTVAGRQARPSAKNQAKAGCLGLMRGVTISSQLLVTVFPLP